MSLNDTRLNATSNFGTTISPNITGEISTMDWFMSKVDQFPIKLSFFFALSMVLGSVVPYIPQYFTIKQTQNTEGFSLYVCFTLLVANILRIMFWFGKKFEIPLLIQSIIMIFAMFALLELCVRVRNSNLIIQGRQHYFADFDFRYFWEWTDFISYIECMAIFAFVTGIIMFLFINEPLVVETYGLVALVTESLLASPQFFRNWKTKSTEGMSRIMVFSWLIGDIYKTIYFIVRMAPFQFLLCGFTQITFDILIFFQIICYKKNNKETYHKLAKAGKNGQNQVTPTANNNATNDNENVRQQSMVDNSAQRLKARHVASFTNPEVNQITSSESVIIMDPNSNGDERSDSKRRSFEEIALNKLD